MSLTKKIDAMKIQAQRLIVNPPADKLDEIANNISEGYITACDEIMDYVLSEQKEPSEETNICEICEDSDCENCNISTPIKEITIGDKIREDNESLSAFIRGQFGDDRVFHSEGEAGLDDFLNQPYTEIEEAFDRR